MTYTFTINLTVPAGIIRFAAAIYAIYTAILSAVFGEQDIESLDIARIVPGDAPVDGGVYQVFCAGYSYIAHLTAEQATNLYAFGHTLAYCA